MLRSGCHRSWIRTVLALTGVALDHLVAGLEAGEGHVDDRVLLVMGLLCGDDRRKGGEREVNTREAVTRYQRLSFGKPQCATYTYGTKLVWNSFRSTLREPSKRREAVMEETT